MSKRLIKIGEAARLLGASVVTLRKWESTGELLPARKTKGGTRYYNVSDLLESNTVESPTICYARVSSHDQKNDLIRQQEMLEAYCAAKGWRSTTISDLGSGLNYRKKGLHELLTLILNKNIKRLVLTHKDRLLRFGAELVFALCELKGIEIIIIHQGEQPSFEEELAQDVLEIITVFSARLYGSRSHKNKKLISDLRSVVTNV
jgi:putative resolvase